MSSDSSSSKEDVESAALRVLNRCERIEESRREVEESLRTLDGDVEGPDGSPSSSSSSDDRYREQLDQIRRALVTTQVNARLRRDELEEEVEALRRRAETFERDRDEARRERDAAHEQAEATARECDGLKSKLADSVAWIERARAFADETRAENERLRRLAFALGGRAAAESRRSLAVKEQEEEEHDIEEEKAPSAAGESPMEGSGGGSSRDRSKKLTTPLVRPSLRELGGRMMLSSRRLIDPK